MKSNHNYTFGDRVIRFFDSLQIPKNLPPDIEVVYPFARDDVRRAVEGIRAV